MARFISIHGLLIWFILNTLKKKKRRENQLQLALSPVHLRKEVDDVTKYDFMAFMVLLAIILVSLAKLLK